MTTCESSSYTGASFSITDPSHLTPFRGWGLAVSSLFNNILFLADVKMISSRRQQKPPFG